MNQYSSDQIFRMNNLPKPAQKNISIRVNASAQRAIRQGHPWVYASSITHQNREGMPGDLAVLFDQKRNFLAVGLYDPNSIIRVRILQFDHPSQINSDWLLKKILQALKLRTSLIDSTGSVETNGYRLIYGENDGLPGLVIDCYADTVVLKLYTSAWIPYLPLVVEVLSQVLSFQRIVLRLNRAVKKDADHYAEIDDGLILAGEPLQGPVFFKENGLVFEAEPVIGQKTGFFLDQRENRKRVETLAHGLSVLNVFAYTGGFSVYAGRGGASRITSVDLSEPAMDAAQRNWDLNRIFPNIRDGSHQGIVGDAFYVLEQMAKERSKFDLVILDPPMFAHRQDQIKNAISAYKRLTRLGLGVLTSGGILVQASCSSRISAAEFYSAVSSTIVSCGRSFDLIEQSEHPIDHPVTIPEGAYLKCVFGRVS